MLRYLINIYKQLKKIFGIKGILETIHHNLESNLSIPEQEPQWQELKQRIFSCGSLYVKFLQWYISKLKSNILDIQNNKHQQIKNTNLNANLNANLNSFISFFEDIFENCPFHLLEDTYRIFVGEGGMTGITLEKYIFIDTLQEIASGSIGQVYYARRRTDGCEIAIKVKHPDITSNLEEQLSIIRFLGYCQKFSFIRKRYNLIFDVNDFLNDINQQCDFNNEASNCIQFRDNFNESKEYIVFPKVLFQSEDILVSEYIPGYSFDSLTDIQKHMTVLNFVCFFYQMLLVDNFCHGDLHCKNWKVRITEKAIPQIVVYDCGICFKNSSAQLSSDFWFSLGKYDIHGLKEILKKFIIQTESNATNASRALITDEILTNEIGKIFETILNNSVGTGMVMKSIINYFTSHNILIDKFLLNFTITICLLEEFFRKNDVVDREKAVKNNTVSMYDIIQENILDIISFCKVKKCYPKVLELFTKELNTRYQEYRENIYEHNINECNKQYNPVLFNSIALSGMVMRPPE
jgi:predicted unusual protein kinase regulating ubiquinone biosynthesis (AarF/ABC1/UbiB family)